MEGSILVPRTKAPQMFQIDGEALWFNDFVKLEVARNAVDVIVDYQQLMRQGGLAKPSTQ